MKLFVNTENQERIFQQTKQIALKCTNRKPENVIPSVLIRLQAKGITGKLSNIYQSAKTRVENVASKSPCFPGTKVSKSFITERSHSWQAHLKRISAYLVSSYVWWNATSEFFFYGDNDPQWRVEGPKLYHFRSNSIEDVETKCNENWKIILENKNELPTTVLRNFDENGDFISYLINNSVHVSNDEPTHVSNDEPTHVSNDEQFSLMSPSGPSIYNNISISEFSPLLNTCITTPQITEDACLPLSSTPSSSQTCVTPNQTSQPVRRQLVPELEENCEIIDDYATSDVLNQVYVSKHVQLIAKVIGDSAELATFDSLHVMIR